MPTATAQPMPVRTSLSVRPQQEPIVTDPVTGETALTPTLAQQVYVIGSGIAGGLAGFILAARLAGARSVPIPSLLLATLVSGAATFGSVYLIQINRE